jgi:hypothetical protein
MSNVTTYPAAIRLRRTPEIARALEIAKLLYPTLTDPEILKVGLARLTTMDDTHNETVKEIPRSAAYSLNLDGYLDDPSEDIYSPDSRKM